MKSDNTPLFPLLSSKDEGLRDIGNSMRIRNLMLGLNSVTVSVLIRCNTLSQNATDILTKCDSYFVTKGNRSLLQNVSGLLLQNETIHNLVLPSVYFKNIT